jgi:hypothetical protein
MGLSKNVTMLLSILVIAGCAPPDRPPRPKTVFEPLTQQVDRAREVQKTVDEHADSSREAVDTQERGDTSH